MSQKERGGKEKKSAEKKETGGTRETSNLLGTVLSAICDKPCRPHKTKRKKRGKELPKKERKKGERLARTRSPLGIRRTGKERRRKRKKKRSEEGEKGRGVAVLQQLVCRV